MEARRSQKRPLGITALVGFFSIGTLISLTAAFSLLIPGSVLEPIWRINPQAREQFASIGGWSPVILFTVSLVCGAAARGCWRGRQWGYRLAVGLFVVNLIGDVANATLRGELRGLLGIPVVIGLLWYLTRPSVRAYFAATP